MKRKRKLIYASVFCLVLFFASSSSALIDLTGTNVPEGVDITIYLNDLDDVNAGSPSDDDSLTWDDATSKWIPESVSGSDTDVFWNLTGTSLWSYEGIDIETNETLRVGGNLFCDGSMQLGGDLAMEGSDLSVRTLNTGNGANELYDMNQNVQTTDDVHFNSVDVDKLETEDIDFQDSGANFRWDITVDADGLMTWELEEL